MPRGVTRSQLQTLNDLLDKYEPSVARAFLDAMDDWRANVDTAAIIKALQANDINAAIAALHMDVASLQVFIDEVTSSYMSAGKATAAPFPKFLNAQTGARFTIGFNGRDPIAEAWLRQMAGRLITDITNGQRDAVRAILEAGLVAGDGPGTTALLLVGAVGQNGKRQGGVIGLNGPQADYLAAAKVELSSNDPALLRNYLTRTLRDRRFDSWVNEAIADGIKIPTDIRNKMLVSYSNALLKLRGETIARTETLPALHAAQDEAVRQGIAGGGINPKAATKSWRSAHDSHVRHTHQVLDLTTRKKPVPYDRPFVSPSGARMMFPGDRKLGAPASEIIGCRCIAPVHIDFFLGIK